MAFPDDPLRAGKVTPRRALTWSGNRGPRARQAPAGAAGPSGPSLPRPPGGFPGRPWTGRRSRVRARSGRGPRRRLGPRGRGARLPPRAAADPRGSRWPPAPPRVPGTRLPSPRAVAPAAFVLGSGSQVETSLSSLSGREVRRSGFQFFLPGSSFLPTLRPSHFFFSLFHFR